MLHAENDGYLQHKNNLDLLQARVRPLGIGGGGTSRAFNQKKKCRSQKLRKTATLSRYTPPGRQAGKEKPSWMFLRLNKGGEKSVADDAKQSTPPFVRALSAFGVWEKENKRGGAGLGGLGIRFFHASDRKRKSDLKKAFFEREREREKHFHWGKSLNPKKEAKVPPGGGGGGVAQKWGAKKLLIKKKGRGGARTFFTRGKKTWALEKGGGEASV